jgi:hypothetical protein
VPEEKPKRRWLRRLAIVVGLIALTVLVPIAYIETQCRTPLGAPAQSAARTLPPITDAGYQRNEAWTYFTFPEWYIVYSFEDFGKFLDAGNESAFPYVQHIAGFWQSFCTINRIGASRPEPLGEVKTMVYVIGISYSAELAIKGIYENTIGRVSEWIRGSTRTPEDNYARKVSQDYAAFLYTIPWYKFPFAEKLSALWSLGEKTPSHLRSIERKLSLSAEYGVKIGYAWLIAKALDASSDPAPQEIMFVARNLPAGLLAKEPRLKVVRALDPQHQLINIPRYKAFTDIMRMLARDNAPIVEIGGNDEILMTAVLKDGAAPSVAGVRELFSMPLGARPGFRRAGFDVRVGNIGEAVRTFEAAGADVEHFYDY